MKSSLFHIRTANLCSFFLIAFYFNSVSQSLIDLRPIEVKNSLFKTRYYFGNQTFDSTYSLQFLLIQVKDLEVDKKLKKIKRSRNISKILNLLFPTSSP